MSSFGETNKTKIEEELNYIRRCYISNDDFLCDLFEVNSYIMEQIKYEREK